MVIVSGMIAVRNAAPFLLALLSLAACADDGRSGMTDTAHPDPARTGKPHYPAGLESVHGFAKMTCDITPEGNTQSCRCTASTSSAFCAAGLDFAAHAHYLPALTNGVPVLDPHHTITVNFRPTPGATLHPRLIVAQSGHPDFSSLRNTLPPVSFDVTIHCMIMPNGLAQDCSAHSAWAPIEPIMTRYAAHGLYVPAAPDGIPIAAPWDKTWHLFATQVTPDGFDN